MILKCAIFLTIAQIRSAPIWEIGKALGGVPEVDINTLDPREFFDTYKRVPFVFRAYQRTLRQLSTDAGFSEPLEWLRSIIANDDLVDSVEGELRETRLAPTIHKVKWKYFLEKFMQIDMYAVTQAPSALRKYLKLMPAMSCGGIHDNMVAPHLWVSGGVEASKSVIHMDSYVNQHCVLQGRKRFMLIPANVPITTPEYGWVDTEVETLDGFEDAYGAFFGMIDTDNVDLKKFPKWNDVPWFKAELNAGDCIYMPYGWFHYVESDPQITVSWHQWFNIPNEWREDDYCEENLSYTTDQCLYANDKHRKNRQRIDWSSYTDRTSLCYK